MNDFYLYKNRILFVKNPMIGKAWKFVMGSQRNIFALSLIFLFMKKHISLKSK